MIEFRVCNQKHRESEFFVKVVSYNPLWKLLIDMDLDKKELMYRTGISSSTMHKLKHNENVTIDILLRICEALDCDFADIVMCKEMKNGL